MKLDHLKRREFITLIGGVAAAWPLAAPRDDLAIRGRTKADSAPPGKAPCELVHTPAR